MTDVQKYEKLTAYIRKVSDDVNKVLANKVADEEFANIHELLSYQYTSGGKRLRPTLTALVAQSLGGDYKEAVNIATSCELLHSGSLSFDDILDLDFKRRGKPATHVLFGVGSAIMGGVLFSALALNIGISKSSEIGKVLSETTVKLSVGNAEELMNRKYNMDSYLRIIGMKTASLISAATQIGAMIADTDDKRILNAAEMFGYNLGMIYQICDDLVAIKKSIEYNEPEEDLEDHVITLPLIHLYNTTTDPEIKGILEKYRAKMPLTDEDYEKLIKALKESDVIEYTEKAIEGYKKEALKHLGVFPDNEYTELLKLTPDFVYDVFMAEV